MFEDGGCKRLFTVMMMMINKMNPTPPPIAPNTNPWPAIPEFKEELFRSSEVTLVEDDDDGDAVLAAGSLVAPPGALVVLVVFTVGVDVIAEPVILVANPTLPVPLLPTAA